MPNTSTLIDLGDHALEVSANGGILIASHPQSGEIPIREVVQLDEDEALKLLSALRARYPLERECKLPGDDNVTNESSYYVPPRLAQDVEEHGDQ